MVSLLTGGHCVTTGICVNISHAVITGLRGNIFIVEYAIPMTYHLTSQYSEYVIIMFIMSLFHDFILQSLV